MLAFLRLSTRADLFPRPLDVKDALEVVEKWIGAPAAVMVEPTSRHFHVLAGLLSESGTGGNLTNDAHLAALAVEHNSTVVTYDSDFGRFRGVRWAKP